MPRTYNQGTPAERFEARVQKSEGCWEWQGYRVKRRGQDTGYGKFGLSREATVLAHRFAYELWVGLALKDVRVALAALDAKLAG